MKYWVTNGCFHVDFEHLCAVRPQKWYVDEWTKQPEDLYSEGNLIELPDDTETLIIPEGVERLVNGSFDSIPGLKRLVLPKSMKKIEPFSIINMDITSIEFPEGLKKVGGVSNCNLLEEVYVPDGSEEIMEHGFAWNNGLKTVRLPASLRKISSMAFERCINLQTINLPEGLVSFGNSAFSGCKSLKTLVIPSSFRSSGGKDHYSFPDGLEEVTFYSCFKGFEAELGWVKRFYIPPKIYKTVRRAYPDKEIYDLEGNLLEDDNASFAQSSTGASMRGDYQFPKFSNFEKDIPADGINWHITFKGAASANRAWRTAQEVAGGSEDEKLYDSAELTRYNHPLYEDFDRQVLKDGSGFERQYSKELEPQEILNRAYDFISSLEKGLKEENLPSLIDLLPHKKNGTLCIGRKNVLLTCSFCDHQGMSYSFFAKSVSDTEVELTVKKVYIGDTEYTKDDLVNTFRAILPTDHPIVQPVKTVKTTKENKSPEKKTAGKNTAAKETTVKPVEPEAEKQDTESAEDRDEDDDRSCAVQAADTCYIYIWVETKNGNTYECKYSDQNDRVHGDRNFPGTQKSVLKKLNSMGDFVGLARRWFAEGAYFLEGKEDSEIDEDYGQGDLEKISALKPEDVNHITVEWGVDSSEIQFDKEKEYDADELALFGTATAKAPQKKPQKKIYFSDVHPEKRREAIMKEYSDVIITDVAELDFKGKHVWDRGINEDYEDENVTDIDAHNYILFHSGKISMNMDEKTDYMMISHDGQSNYQKMNELNKKGAAIRAFFAEDLIDIIKREYVEETEKGHLLVKHLAYCVTHRRLSDKSFCGYDNVTHIELDDQITKITYNAFSYLSQLKYVKLPASLRTIDDNAFMDCKSLETIELPETLRKIGEDAFDNCISLKSISLPESLKQIERGAFSCCKSFETIRLPKAVKQIKESMFSGCEKLKEIVWPDQLERIGDKAFGACLGLNEISIPKSCRTIGECAFIYCFNLKTVRISGPIKKIPLQAFFHCNQLETVVIDHDALERIDPTAFDECPLVEIVLPDTPNYRKKVDEGVFPDKYKYRFAGSEAPKEIKKDSDISGETADQTKNEQKDSEKKTAGKKPATKKTTVKPDKPEAKAPVSPKKDSNKPDVKTKPDDIGKITTKASEPAKKKPANKAKTTEMAPAGAVNAADKTTAVPETEVKTTLETPPPDETSSPANLIIPEGVKEIAGWAYRRKPIENVVLPKSLKKIGVCAFEECKKLKSIEFPDGLESIDHYAFHGCTQLKEVHLPDSIKEINVRAFAERNASGPIIHLSSDLIRRIAKGRETEYSVLNGRSFVIDGEQFRTIKEYLTYTEKNRQVEEEMAREEKKKAASAASFSAARINTAGQAGNTYGSGSWGTQKKKRYTADMMPPGTDNPEQVAEELNEMEPERAKQMLELLAVVNRVSNTLNHLSDTVNNMAGNKPAQESDQRERIWRRIYELEEKRDNLKGLFVEFRKRKLQNEIDRLKEELKQL